MPVSGVPEAPAMPDTMVDGGASPMMGGGMDMENNNMDMGNDGFGVPPQSNPTNQMPTDNQFGADFDAGVDADEESDPKKFIQQLTGKLSQSLRKYNEGLPQPDADLNKYVAGMIVKQCIEGLGQDDVQGILDKIKTDDEGGEPQSQPIEQNIGQDAMGQQPMGDQPIQQSPMNENASRRQSITSRYEEFTGENEDGNERVRNRDSYYKRPWVGKTFKA